MNQISKWLLTVSLIVVGIGITAAPASAQYGYGFSGYDDYGYESSE